MKHHGNCESLIAVFVLYGQANTTGDANFTGGLSMAHGYFTGRSWPMAAVIYMWIR